MANHSSIIAWEIAIKKKKKKVLFGQQIAKKEKKDKITKTMSSVCLLVSMPDP